MMAIEDIAVVGAGSWGTCLARHLARQGLRVDLWAYEEEVAAQIARGENQTFLPGVRLPENLHPSTDLGRVVAGKQAVLLVAPSHVCREVLTRMRGQLRPGCTLVTAAKGIENETLMTVSQIMEEVLPYEGGFHLAVLSGPSFAREVSQDLPTAITIASHDHETGRRLQELFASPLMRVYTSPDLIGVELGGALKNVIAIATGILDGLGLGLNARAAFITRGLAEITRLGVHLGANPLTFSGLAGMGDLVLTCTGDLSRNRTVGLKLGRGMGMDEILREMKMVAEGVKTTRSAHHLALREGVDMPITAQMFQVLYEGKTVREAMLDLLARKLKPELDHGGY